MGEPIPKKLIGRTCDGCGRVLTETEPDWNRAKGRLDDKKFDFVCCSGECLIVAFNRPKQEQQPTPDPRVHPCVLAVACPQCGAAIGERCLGARGRIVATHFMRRDNFGDLKRGKPLRWKPEAD